MAHHPDDRILALHSEPVRQTMLELEKIAEKPRRPSGFCRNAPPALPGSVAPRSS
jgi:hypothetical protein